MKTRLGSATSTNTGRHARLQHASLTQRPFGDSAIPKVALVPEETMMDVNICALRLKGVTKWRRLYLRIISQLRPASVMEFGAGGPSLLAAVDNAVKRIALDGNASLRPLYEAHGIDFLTIDFDHDPIPSDLVENDIAVCSDVFEHLLYPQRTLRNIAACLGENGVLLSHVPNEFRLKKNLRVMFGKSSSVLFHEGVEEWKNPHLRRFTDQGYRQFLELSFAYNLKLTDLEYGLALRTVSALGLSVPFCLKRGPTYASTNDAEVYHRLQEIKKRLPRDWSSPLLAG